MIDVQRLELRWSTVSQAFVSALTDRSVAGDRW